MASEKICRNYHCNMLVANQNSTKNSLDKTWFAPTNYHRTTYDQELFRDQGFFPNQMMNLQDQGIFQKGGIFNIKGSLRSDEFQDQGIFHVVSVHVLCGFTPTQIFIILYLFVIVDSWAEWLSTRAGEKLGAATEKCNAQRWRNRCFCWFDDFQYCTWITLPAFADKFWIAGGFVNTMNLPGCNWGCSSLVRYSHPNPWRSKIMLRCYVYC